VAERLLNFRAIRLCTLLCLALLAFGAATARADLATFAPTGGEQQWIVPAGVTSIRVIAVGGKGGGGKGGEAQTGVGGLGAIASADLPVTPGQVLFVEVGTNGANSTGQTGGAGGFNGGGSGGDAGERALGGGGGGGATDLRTLPRSAAGSLTTRLIVAGGGAGGGGGTELAGDSFNSRGGDAEADGVADGNGSKGGGATPTQPGGTGGNGEAGQLGFGGPGGNGSLQFAGGGGGGGGGAFGGGGGSGDVVAGAGDVAGGGGGGSSAFSPGATNTSRALDAAGSPGLSILYTPAPAAPTPRLGSLPSSLTVSKNRRYTFSFSATPGLPGTAQLVSANKFRVGKKKKKLVLTDRSFSAPASGTVKLNLTLSKKAFGLLTSLGQIRVNAKLTLNGANGVTDTATKSLVLRAPKPPRR
jgi:Glycine rich protein